MTVDVDVDLDAGRMSIGQARAYAYETAHWLEELQFMLDQGLNAWDAARALGVKDTAAVETRLERAGLADSEIAESFRRRKPGYCPRCRKVNGQHLASCIDNLIRIARPSRGARS